MNKEAVIKILEPITKQHKEGNMTDGEYIAFKERLQLLVDNHNNKLREAIR